jgi:hypothetical protein
MKRVFQSLLLLVLPFMFMTDGVSGNKTQDDVVKELNQRLADKKVPYKVDGFGSGKFIVGALSYQGTGAFGDKTPLILTGNRYSNNSSVEQEISFEFSETITSSSTWNVTAGLEVGVGLETTIKGGIPGLGGGEAKASGSIKVSASAGKGGTDETEKAWKETRNIKIAPYKIIYVSAACNEQKSTEVPFTIPVWATGPFKVVPTDLIALYRFWKSPDHFYSTAKDEGTNAKYAAEGITCLINKTKQPGTVELHRFYHGKIGDHFYSLSKDEGTKAGYNYEGVVGWVYPTASNPKLIPLYRYYNSKSGDHFYTQSKAEGDGAGGYKSEGITCYVFPSNYGDTLQIDDVLDENARKFLVEGVAYAAQQVDTEVSIEEETIPKKDQSKNKTKVKKEMLSDADKDKITKKLSSKKKTSK